MAAMRQRPGARGAEAAFILPFAFAGLLVIGVLAVAEGGRFPASGVGALAVVLVAVLCSLAEARAAVPIAVIGWFAYAGFAHPPYGELTFRGTGPATVVLALSAAAAASLGALLRRRLARRGAH